MLFCAHADDIGASVRWRPRYLNTLHSLFPVPYAARQPHDKAGPSLVRQGRQRGDMSRPFEFLRPISSWSALELLLRYTQNEGLRKHALSVEIVMSWQARKHGADPEEWGNIGLVHDLDWEMWPKEHCQATRRILEEAGWPESYIRAVEAHAWELFTDVKPETQLERTLYACDELTGFITACALVGLLAVSSISRCRQCESVGSRGHSPPG